MIFFETDKEIWRHKMPLKTQKLVRMKFLSSIIATYVELNDIIMKREGR